MKSIRESRATISIKLSTKKALDRYRAPGQCYDGFLRQMIANWKRSQGNN